jgi:uncharacterized membrane protein YfcA
VNWIAIVCIGAGVGFTAGMFGKGGSAIATPLLHAFGVPAIIAVAAPLPATIPSTIVASGPYWKGRHVDLRLVRWSVGVGVPAAIVGAVATRWIDGSALVRVTDVIIALLGVRFLLGKTTPHPLDGCGPVSSPLRMALVAGVVGVTSGLLANSGGFLLAPLYLSILHKPIRAAFGSSLVVSTALAIPSTIVHASLGHIDWRVVAMFGVASIPLSSLGARVAQRVRPAPLERIYGAVLAVLGLIFLLR